MKTPLVTVITPVKAKHERDVKWLGLAIQSVINQEFSDWQMILINDHSKVSLKSLADLIKDERIQGITASSRGVSNARNQGASLAKGKLITGLDHDDLLPPSALKDLTKAWEPGRVVYGGCRILVKDAQKIYRPPAYSFNLLLRTLIMHIGSMHSKEDWKKSGGWKPEMENGLEDWEYWITLGEHGVCGKRINSIVYVYRRHPYSRLAEINKTPNRFTEAYHRIRKIHEDTFMGRRPVMCCGGADGGALPSVAKTRSTAGMSLPIPIEAIGDGQLVQVKYVGGMKASFGLVGEASGFRYNIPGTDMMVMMPDGRPGVDHRDLPYLRRQNRGRDFSIPQ